MTIWRGKLKTELCILVDHSYQAELFSILAIGQKYFYQPFISWLFPLRYKLDPQFLFIIPGVIPTLNLPIKSHPSSRWLFFFWCSFSIKLSLFQRRANKVITMQYVRFYLQNCKVITLAKKYKPYQK